MHYWGKRYDVGRWPVKQDTLRQLRLTNDHACTIRNLLTAD